MAFDDAARVHDTMRAWAAAPRRGVLFDFNGTLSNDEPDLLFEVFGAVFAEALGWRMTEADYRGHLAGLSDTEIVTWAVRRHGSGTASQVAELKARHAAAYKLRAQSETLIEPGTVELVEMLAAQGVLMGIVTGAQRTDVLAVLATSSIGTRFPVIVTDEDVRQGKPDPEGYLKGAALLGVPAADILVFEDSVVGVEAALAAGMRCIAVGDAAQDVAPCTIDRLGAELLSS